MKKDEPKRVTLNRLPKTSVTVRLEYSPLIRFRLDVASFLVWLGVTLAGGRLRIIEVESDE